MHPVVVRGYYRWQALALCGDVDPEVFFAGDELAAKRVCWRCPVRPECLVAGLRESFGVWGGLSEQERRLVQRRSGIDWAAAEQFADPVWTAKHRGEVRRRVVEDYEGGRSVSKIAHRHNLPTEDVVEILADSGYRQASGDALAPVCKAGHEVVGDNRVRNGTTRRGRQRWACARCMRARLRRVCVRCGERSSAVVCDRCET